MTKRGFTYLAHDQTAIIGVEPKETRNISIYFHWGYDTFVKSEISDIEEEGLILYYSKGL